ncbi:MAG: TlyA family RNA methyltransferase [Flavobacteriales bacterium]
MIRLDKLLTDKGLVESRQTASDLIEEGGVQVNGTVVSKPGKKFPEDVSIELIKQPLSWVSKGALKLLAALEHWEIDVKDLEVMDVGSGTGGFTEVLLSRNVGKIIAIDSGKDQMPQELISNAKVDLRDNTNFKTMPPLDPKMQMATVDISYSPLKSIWPLLQQSLVSGAHIIAVVKPQFEVVRNQLTRGGVVVNDLFRSKTLDRTIKFAERENFEVIGWIESPVDTKDHNREYIIYLRRV